MLTRDEFDVSLKVIEIELPSMMLDMQEFFYAFEDKTELLLADVPPEDEQYALDRLKDMIVRTGIYD